MFQLCNALLRPLLENCMQFWSSYCRKDVITVERRFDRMLAGMEHFSCEKRLERPGLISLEQSVLKGEVIEVYKIESYG